MIKDKLVLYNDYSCINKTCFSCNQGNHIVEECPKLHYMPNIERIIKKYNFPQNNERKSFSRMKKYKTNSLHLMRSNFKSYIKLTETLKQNQNDNESEDLIYEEGEFSEENDPIKKSFNHLKSKENFISSKSDLSPHLFSIINEEEDDGSLLHLERKEKEASLVIDRKESDNKRKSFLQNHDMKSNLFHKTSSLKNFENFNEHSKENIKENNKENIKENNKESIKDKENSMIDDSKIKEDKNLINHIDNHFETVYDFENYFPLSNLSHIIKIYSKYLRLQKDVEKRFLKKKYKNLKYYLFSPNFILEKFLNEARLIIKKRKSIGKNEKSSHLKNFIEKNENYSKIDFNQNFLIHNQKHDGVEKFQTNYFHRRKATQIKSIGDLLKAMIQSKIN